MLMKDAFAECNQPCELDCISSGDEAISRMFREGSHTDSELPDLVILDINLPGTSGREVLMRIRANSMLCHIPIIVMSGSSAAQDLVASYQRLANSYIVKPFGLDELAEVAQSILSYWARTVSLASDLDVESQISDP